MSLLESLQRNLPDYPRFLGMTYVEASPDRLIAEITVREDMSNGGGNIHGGALMTFADTLGAVATMLNIPREKRTTTLESKTNFVGPAPVGAKLIGEATPLHRGRSTQIWETRVTTAEGKLVAKVTQTQIVL
jgi:1,4-dihydroxy-2-naphthoyl-CoA hydrolase